MKKTTGPFVESSVKGLETREKRVVCGFLTWLTNASVSPLTNTDSIGVLIC